jgi:magnesium/nickel/cobalt transporter corA
MKTVLNLKSSEALKYFMETSNYCSLPLPLYFNFQTILDSVESIPEEELNKCIKNRTPSKFDGVNYSILISKNGKYSFRQLSVANPFLYCLLARTITKIDNWNLIMNKFKEFKNPKIEVSSMPVQKDKNDKNRAATTIRNWWESIEQRTIELSMEYKYMFITDITDCYSSIYTHTIEWAILGKKAAKANKNMGKNKKEGKENDKKDHDKSVGCLIDEYIRAMQYGQTNGIPQGSVLFDFIAEIVLGYADLELTKQLEKESIEKYKILRYRDDYRIFSNSKEEIEKIVLNLHKVLADLNFKMNPSKTLLTEDILEHAIKPDKLYRITHNYICKEIFTLQDELYNILLISKTYQNSGTICKLLSNIGVRIEKMNKIKGNIQVLIAILTEIIMKNPAVLPQAITCISRLIQVIAINNNKMDNTDNIINNIIYNIYNRLSSLPNIGYIQIWMQRLTYKYKILAKEYDEPLCKLVQNEEVKELWNLEWLEPSLRDKISLSSICDKEKRDSMSQTIKTEETVIFSDSY